MEEHLQARSLCRVLLLHTLQLMFNHVAKTYLEPTITKSNAWQECARVVAIKNGAISARAVKQSPVGKRFCYCWNKLLFSLRLVA